jgi:Cu/Ag efflux pump CusA
LINHYQHLEEEEGETFGPQLVLRGSVERVTPMVMLGLTAGIALVPLLLAGNIPGNEIEYPMAIVILGGLLTSELLNLFFVPMLYLHFGKSRRERRVLESNVSA